MSGWGGVRRARTGLPVQARQRRTPANTFAGRGWDCGDPGRGVTSLIRTDHIGRPVFATNTTGVKLWTGRRVCAGLRGLPPQSPRPGRNRTALHQRAIHSHDAMFAALINRMRPDGPCAHRAVWQDHRGQLRMQVARDFLVIIAHH